MLLFSLLLGALCLLLGVGGTTTVPVTDPNWYFTEFNWGEGEGYRQAVNPGAYFKVGFSGTSISVLLNFNGTVTTNYTTMKYILDGLPEVNVQLPVPNGVLPIASNMTNTNHTLLFFIKNSYQLLDRWWTPVCVTRVTGLLLDDGASTLPVPLRPKRMLVFWDSIGEGVNVNDIHGPGQNDLTENDSTVTWAMALAAAMEAEVSMAAFGGLGWSCGGMGLVPALYTPGNDTASSWNKIDSLHPRNFNAAPLDYIVIGHGTNDGLSGKPADLVQAAAFGWLVDQRAAVGAAVPIFMVIPFGGYERETLTQVYEVYQNKFMDNSTFLIDLGYPAQEGIDRWIPATGTWQSVEGIHPNIWYDGHLAAMLTRAISRIIDA